MNRTLDKPSLRNVRGSESSRGSRSDRMKSVSDQRYWNVSTHVVGNGVVVVVVLQRRQWNSPRSYAGLILRCGTLIDWRHFDVTRARDGTARSIWIRVWGCSSDREYRFRVVRGLVAFWLVVVVAGLIEQV